jgi:hypothetical protein
VSIHRIAIQRNPFIDLRITEGGKTMGNDVENFFSGSVATGKERYQ